MRRKMIHFLFCVLLGLPVFAACSGSVKGNSVNNNPLNNIDPCLDPRATCDPPVSDPRIVCDSPGAIRDTLPPQVNFGVTIYGLNGPISPGHIVEVAFSSGVLEATNLGDGSLLNLDGDQARSDDKGRLEIRSACNVTGDEANPCSVTFSATFGGEDGFDTFNDTCTIVY